MSRYRTHFLIFTCSKLIIGIYFASGKGGQKIIVIPELDMIVVTTTNVDAWEGAWYQNQWVLRIVAYNILIPIRNQLGSPPYSPCGAQALKVENRSLLLREYINVITWEDNLRNADENVVGVLFELEISSFHRGILRQLIINQFWQRNYREEQKSNQKQNRIQNPRSSQLYFQKN